MKQKQTDEMKSMQRQVHATRTHTQPHTPNREGPRHMPHPHLQPNGMLAARSPASAPRRLTVAPVALPRVRCRSQFAQQQKQLLEMQKLVAAQQAAMMTNPGAMAMGGRPCFGPNAMGRTQWAERDGPNAMGRAPFIQSPPPPAAEVSAALGRVG